MRASGRTERLSFLRRPSGGPEGATASSRNASALRRAAAAALASFLFGAANASEDPATPENPPPAQAAESERSRLQITGFVDIYYAYNFDRPADQANFFPGVGTTAKRDNEFAINLAQVDFILDPKPVGVHFAAGYGTSLEVVHGAEVEGVATSPDSWRNIVQASIQVQTGLGKGLLVEAGLYPSHIGAEAFQTKDNWNYTRSYLGEFSPYYQVGVKVAYPLGAGWTSQVHFLNGWQQIADVNRGKSLGWQFARAGEKVLLSFNGIVGPELPDNDHDLRALLDTIVTWKATPAWNFTFCLDLGGQEQPAGGDARWEGVGAYARFAPPSSKQAFGLRAEYYDDKEGAISGTEQILREVTATWELRPVERFILKIEGRYDRSSAEIFAGDQLDASGEALRDQCDEALLLVGAVATF